MNYTPSQREAINTVDHNLQIIACAGSGKTQVISERIVEILRIKKQEGITPDNIVAFTFTEKAAGELKDRIHRLCKEQLGSDLGLAEMFVGTIHAYCLNSLQAPPLYRFLKYSVLTEVQQRLLIDKYSDKSGLTRVPLLTGGHLQRWKDSRLYQQLLGICGEGNIDSTKVPDGVRVAIQDYYSLLDGKKYLDYTMIISQAVVELKKNPDLQARVSSQVKYLIVDEYQDVNPLQEMLIHEIHRLGANLCVVGDDDQTIYQWRGSDVRNIITFGERYPAVKQVPLNENFRSSLGIILTARKVIENNPARLPKEMESTEAQPCERGDILALKFKHPGEEADWIAEKIKSFIGIPYQDKKDAPIRGLTYSDFAILLRSVRNDAEPILAALDSVGIRYVVGGMNGLFDTDEVQVIRNVFFYLANFAPKGSSPLTSEDLKGITRASRLGLTEKQITAGIACLRERKARIGTDRVESLYLQRVFLDFLESIELREEGIDRASGRSGTGEIVFFNLGKFSQVISDFEQVHFNTYPSDIYPSFASFLYYQAPEYYPEGWEDKAISRPDAVQVMTVHQAKGMQWPVVFVPCLRQNRFPSRRQGGRSVWHIIPESIIENADRYKGTVEDERRLLYVALTRAEKYIFCSWAPIPDNQQQRRVSRFFREITESEFVLTKEPSRDRMAPVTSRPRKEEQTIVLSFSELKYYFECPYIFKLKFLYGFNPPIDQALGYGRSLHNALAEVHAESIRGRIPRIEDVPRLVDEHLHLPFASPPIVQNLRQGAERSLMRYIRDYGESLSRLEHVEQVIELKLGDGIVISGRIDLIRRTDTNETTIVDFKSDERAQTEDISQKQLHIYAVGYEQLSGRRADLIEVHNLDKGGAKREVVDDAIMTDTLTLVSEAGRRLRENYLPRHPAWCATCATCDVTGICRSREITGSKS